MWWCCSHSRVFSLLVDALRTSSHRLTQRCAARAHCVEQHSETLCLLHAVGFYIQTVFWFSLHNTIRLSLLIHFYLFPSDVVSPLSFIVSWFSYLVFWHDVLSLIPMCATHELHQCLWAPISWTSWVTRMAWSGAFGEGTINAKLVVGNGAAESGRLSYEYLDWELQWLWPCAVIPQYTVWASEIVFHLNTDLQPATEWALPAENK